MTLIEKFNCGCEIVSLTGDGKAILIEDSGNEYFPYAVTWESGEVGLHADFEEGTCYACSPNIRRKIVCYCGSLRVAMEAFKKAEYEAVLKGEIALLPCCMFVDIQREYGAESDYKQKADDLHKRKIDICDEVFVLNVGGYIGESTRSEIEYAEKIGKPIKYLEPEPPKP